RLPDVLVTGWAVAAGAVVGVAGAVVGGAGAGGGGAAGAFWGTAVGGGADVAWGGAIGAGGAEVCAGWAAGAHAATTGARTEMKTKNRKNRRRIIELDMLQSSDVRELVRDNDQ